MASDARFYQIDIQGVELLRAGLVGLPKQMRNKVLRKAVRDGAKLVQQQAKANAPVLQKPVPHRTRGLVARSLKVVNSKLARKRGDIGVFVTVKRVKGAKRGANSPTDPFYFRFVEEGTKKMAARRFIGRAAQSEGEKAVKLIVKQATQYVKTVTAVQAARG